MNWSDISPQIAKYAPMAAMALSSPAGAAVSIGTLIANLFGVKSKPEEVMDYIKNNPEKAEERIKFEMANNIEMQKMAISAMQEQNRNEEQMASIELQNMESARNNTNSVNESPVDNTIKMRALNFNMGMLFMSVSAFIFTIYWNLEKGTTLDAGLSAMLGMMIGQFSSPLKDVINYFFATSFSSRKKDEFIQRKNSEF